MPGILYVVGTPIGNLGDFSPRGLSALETCDFIAAEDTRVTLKLLNRYGVKKPLVSYFEHNRRERGEEIIARLLSGESCALVTDAGMPAVSDPGEELVAACHDHGIRVESVPGPCAFAAALSVSGMPAGRFTFEGFLSVNRRSRREHLDSLLTERRTMIFYEAPHKLASTLRDLHEAFGDRRIALVKELTKIHETVTRTTLSEAAGMFAEQTPKGEFVLIVEGACLPKPEPVTLEAAAETARGYMADGMSVSDAAKAAAKETGFKKADIYKLLCEISEKG
ncbi:MAG: 16S rRNA (cytidine(1402)-2'-O)-methyltransferase [Oscillospiraceae bacterium]|nr:16S rRNA (cytidine(1402)-2'-O)-methyltransferase [Oscillospiraceae bacterium]